jgi:MYXO-CTERM domain-containing protein
VRFSKIDVAQPADAARPRDPAEAIELEILGPLPAGARLADCGVTRFSPYNANDDEGGCGPAAGYYEEVEIGDLLVPPSRRVVLGLPGSAVYPWPSVSGQSFSVLHDGPDYLVLRGPQGEPRSVVAYPSPERPTILPGCNLFAGVAEILPADAPTSAEPPRDQVLVRCSGGWGLVPLAAVAWGQPTRCPAAEVAAPPDTPEQAGGGAGAPDLPEGGSAGVAGRGGAPVVTELDPGPTPTCGCRLAPDSPGDRRGAALLLGLAGLAARRRGARGGGARSSGGASSFPWEGAGGQNARHGAPRDRSRHHRHDGPPA